MPMIRPYVSDKEYRQLIRLADEAGVTVHMYVARLVRRHLAAHAPGDKEAGR